MQGEAAAVVVAAHRELSECDAGVSGVGAGMHAETMEDSRVPAAGA